MCSLFLQNFVTLYLKSALENDYWPNLPSFNYICSENCINAVAFLMSLDKSGQTTKLMGKFATNNSSQKQADVQILAEAYHVDDKSFSEIGSYLRPNSFGDRFYAL